jgi:hypothetical protein
MPILRKTRLIAAIALLASICLPLSECSKHGDNQARPATKSFVQLLFPQSNSDFEYHYAISAMRFSSWQLGAITLIALIWPIVAVRFDKRLAQKRFGWTIYILELPLCYGTYYWLGFLTLLGRWLYGAYIVAGAILLFACATLFLGILSVRNVLLQRRALKN